MLKIVKYTIKTKIMSKHYSSYGFKKLVKKEIEERLLEIKNITDVEEQSREMHSF